MNAINPSSRFQLADEAPSTWRGIRDLLELASGQRRLLVLTIIATLLAQGGMVSSIAVGGWLVSLVIMGADADVGAQFAQLTPGFIALAIAVFAGAGGRWWQAHVSHDFAFALIETLQISVYDGLERAAPGYVLGRRGGDLAAIATDDTGMLENFFAHLLGDAIAATVVPLLTLFALAALHPLLMLSLAPFLPLLASVPFWLGRQAQTQGQHMGEIVGQLNAQIAEGIQGRRELTLFGQEREWLDRIAAGVSNIALAQRRYGARAGLELMTIELLQAGAVLAAAITGGWLVLAAKLSVEQLPLVVVLVGAALIPLADVAQTARKLGELRAAAARILTIRRQKAAIDDSGQQGSRGASVHFEKVSFGYGNDRDDVLKEVSFEVGESETIALVGRSGHGKSTCANLLMRFWDVHSGRIRVGANDVRCLPVSTLRQVISLVSQDVYLFDDSIENNIRLGRPDASQADVEQAARLAQAHDFIAALPQGYATPCGERGATLSGGERQRIAIARALLRDSPILILDEASSNIDAASEQLFHAAMAELRRNRTVLVIAHRLSTIRQADRIVVLESGRVVEQGTHEELIKGKGAYLQLISGLENSALLH